MSDRPRQASLRLGVAAMDDDHARIDALLARAPETQGGDLPDLLSAVRTELADHFEREEALLRAWSFPGLFCHIAQHRMILADMENSAKASGASLRRLLEIVIPQLVHSHIVTMDGMAASFLKGDASDIDFDVLRLPLPEAVT